MAYPKNTGLALAILDNLVAGLTPVPGLIQAYEGVRRSIIENKQIINPQFFDLLGMDPVNQPISNKIEEVIGIFNKPRNTVPETNVIIGLTQALFKDAHKLIGAPKFPILSKEVATAVLKQPTPETFRELDSKGYSHMRVPIFSNAVAWLSAFDLPFISFKTLQDMPYKISHPGTYSASKENSLRNPDILNALAKMASRGSKISSNSITPEEYKRALWNSTQEWGNPPGREKVSGEEPRQNLDNPDYYSPPASEEEQQRVGPVKYPRQQPRPDFQRTVQQPFPSANPITLGGTLPKDLRPVPQGERREAQMPMRMEQDPYDRRIEQLSQQPTIPTRREGQGLPPDNRMGRVVPNPAYIPRVDIPRSVINPNYRPGDPNSRPGFLDIQKQIGQRPQEDIERQAQMAERQAEIERAMEGKPRTMDQIPGFDNNRGLGAVNRGTDVGGYGGGQSQIQSQMPNFTGLLRPTPQPRIRQPIQPLDWKVNPNSPLENAKPQSMGNEPPLPPALPGQSREEWNATKSPERLEWEREVNSRYGYGTIQGQQLNEVSRQQFPQHDYSDVPLQPQMPTADVNQFMPQREYIPGANQGEGVPDEEGFELPPEQQTYQTPNAPLQPMPVPEPYVIPDIPRPEPFDEEAFNARVWPSHYRPQDIETERNLARYRAEIALGEYNDQMRYHREEYDRRSRQIAQANLYNADLPTLEELEAEARRAHVGQHTVSSPAQPHSVPLPDTELSDANADVETMQRLLDEEQYQDYMERLQMEYRRVMGNATPRERGQITADFHRQLRELDSFYHKDHTTSVPQWAQEGYAQTREDLKEYSRLEGEISQHQAETNRQRQMISRYQDEIDTLERRAMSPSGMRLNLLPQDQARLDDLKSLRSMAEEAITAQEEDLNRAKQQLETLQDTIGNRTMSHNYFLLPEKYRRMYEEDVSALESGLTNVHPERRQNFRQRLMEEYSKLAFKDEYDDLSHQDIANRDLMRRRALEHATLGSQEAIEQRLNEGRQDRQGRAKVFGAMTDVVDAIRNPNVGVITPEQIETLGLTPENGRRINQIKALQRVLSEGGPDVAITDPDLIKYDPDHAKRMDRIREIEYRINSINEAPPFYIPEDEKEEQLRINQEALNKEKQDARDAISNAFNKDLNDMTNTDLILASREAVQADQKQLEDFDAAQDLYQKGIQTADKISEEEIKRLPPGEQEVVRTQKRVNAIMAKPPEEITDDDRVILANSTDQKLLEMLGVSDAEKLQGDLALAEDGDPDKIARETMEMVEQGAIAKLTPKGLRIAQNRELDAETRANLARLEQRVPKIIKLEDMKDLTSFLREESIGLDEDEIRDLYKAVGATPQETEEILKWESELQTYKDAHPEFKGKTDEFVEQHLPTTEYERNPAYVNFGKYFGFNGAKPIREATTFESLLPVGTAMGERPTGAAGMRARLKAGFWSDLMGKSKADALKFSGNEQNAFRIGDEAYIIIDGLGPVRLPKKTEEPYLEALGNIADLWDTAVQSQDISEEDRTKAKDAARKAYEMLSAMDRGIYKPPNLSEAQKYREQIEEGRKQRSEAEAKRQEEMEAQQAERVESETKDRLSMSRKERATQEWEQAQAQLRDAEFRRNVAEEAEKLIENNSYNEEDAYAAMYNLFSNPERLQEREQYEAVEKRLDAQLAQQREHLTWVRNEIGGQTNEQEKSLLEVNEVRTRRIISELQDLIKDTHLFSKDLNDITSQVREIGD